MKILGFIPAREGSKGIKNKNLVKFNGKPLIFSTINFSKKLNTVTSFVSTNSKKILKYAKKQGIYFDYLRPQHLSRDKSDIVEAVLHSLKWFECRQIYFDAVMLLQPTSPIRSVKEVKKIIKIFNRGKIDSMIKVTKMKEHPYECVKIKGNKWGYLEKNPKKKSMRQAYFEDYYFIDGSIYLSKVSFLKKNKSFVAKNKTKLFKSKQHPGIDIDEPIDLKIGEIFIKRK